MNPVNAIDKLQDLVKALEAGNYNAAPSSLVQGSALQVEDLSPVMQVVTFEDSAIKLQKALKVTPCKSNLVQFDRTLAYGIFGGSAQLEGNVGQENTGDYVRITVPMAYYSQVRRVTIASNMVATVDGRKAEDREASAAAKTIAGDIEFDLFRGKADFSNAGVFDGNPLSMPALPNLLGLDAQVRQSDFQTTAQDLMFNEFGSSDSVVIPGGGTLTQSNIEDSSVRSAMNHGSADRLLVDPIVLAAYNKITFGKERIILGGAPQDATGADLRRQWVSGGVVQVEASRFLSGKTTPARQRVNGPSAPSQTGASTDQSGAGLVTSFLSGQVYKYSVTAQNEIGESVQSATTTVTVGGNGYTTDLTITPPGGQTVRYFNVYRSFAGGSLMKFIGRVTNSGAATTNFKDLNNKSPGFVTGYLVQGDTMDIAELSPYSRLKLAISDLSMPEAHYRFCTLRVMQPRKNVLIDNLSG